jgi:hypothetical protein
MNFFENKQNRVITIACLLIALICIYFIQNENLFREKHLTSAEAIGSFNELQKDVRKKNIANYFWDELKLKDSLSEGDSVFTGADSSVTVTLSNGQSIIVAPNSLIKFSYKGKKMVLDIPYGGVEFETVIDDLVISDCGENIDLSRDNAAVKLKKSEKCGSIKMDTQSVVNIKNFEERKTKKDMTDTFMEVAETGVLGRIQKIALSAPLLDTLDIKYKAVEETPLVMSWATVPGATYYEVEVSDTEDFATVEKYKSNTRKYTFKKLSSKMYYRVKAIGVQDAESSYSSVGKAIVEFPMIVMDKLKLTKEYKAKNPRDRGIASTAVDVSWSKVPYIDKYIVELIDTKSKKTVKKTATRLLASALEVPRTGQYSYQVHAADSRGRTVSSSEVGELIYNKIFNILAPVIKQGINDRFYFFQKSTAKYVWLNWIGQSGETARFRVEIARDRKFETIIQSSFTAKSKLLVTDKVEAGEYFWRVRSEEGDRYSDWSNTEMFKIQINSK